MKRFSDLQSRASKRRAKEAAEYSKNWRKIESLLFALGIIGGDQHERLKGLKFLNLNQDTLYPGSTVNQTGPYLVDNLDTIPWIWRVPMLNQGNGANFTGSSTVESLWENEGISLKHGNL
jgi:hypothetical protein